MLKLIMCCSAVNTAASCGLPTAYTNYSEPVVLTAQRTRAAVVIVIYAVIEHWSVYHRSVCCQIITRINEILSQLIQCA